MARSPLTAVPATRSSLPLLRARRRAVIGVAALASVSGLISLGVVLSHNTAPPAPQALPDQGAVALAQTAVGDYFAKRKSSVPAVKDVENDFSKANTVALVDTKELKPESVTFAASTPATLGDGTGAKMLTEQESFTVALDGKLYTVTVPMVKGEHGWLLGAAPAITPVLSAVNQSGTGIDYKALYKQGGDDSLLPPAYRERITSWAKTFAAAGTSSSELLAITGDDSNRTYSGLGGWSVVVDPKVGSVVKVSTPFTGYVVRVSLVLRPPGSNGPTLSTDYDLYLRDNSQQLPAVIAWAAAGSYRSLQPYMNADAR